MDSDRLPAALCLVSARLRARPPRSLACLAASLALKILIAIYQRPSCARACRRLRVKKFPVVDSRRRQPLLVGILGHGFENFDVVANVVWPIVVTHQRTLLGHFR